MDRRSAPERCRVIYIMLNFRKSLLNNALISLLTLTITLAWPLTAAAETVTLQKEKEIGQRFHLRVAAAGVLEDDPIINKYFKQVTSRILKGAGLRPDQYNFYIIRSSGINAFAVPGGYIYMHTETIYSLENEGQLASILGHEVAHITSRHYARRMEAASGYTVATLAAMLAGALVASQGGKSGAELGPAIIGLATGATVSSMLANSREDEAEADAKGHQYLTKAGYNARDMYGAFKIMANKTFQTNPNSSTYLTTHPSLTSRLATTFKDYENAPPAGVDVNYMAFRDRVLALTAEHNRVQSIMTKRLQVNKNDHSARHALGLLNARKQQLTVADKLINEALTLSPNNREYLADLGDLALWRKKPQEAKAYYERADQNNRQVVLGMARSHELLGDKGKAATLYEKAINMEVEPFPEALELGGRFFGSIGQKGKGHYYLGKYFASTGNLKQAVFHFKETEKQPDAGNLRNVAKREAGRIDEIMKEEKKR